MVTLLSGEQFWPYTGSPYLDKIAPVRQFQLIQRSVAEMEAKLVVARPLTAAEEGKLREFIIECLDHPFALRFVYVDEIPRSAGGKFEDFRNEIAT